MISKLALHSQWDSSSCVDVVFINGKLKHAKNNKSTPWKVKLIGNSSLITTCLSPVDFFLESLFNNCNSLVLSFKDNVRTGIDNFVFVKLN